MVDVNVKIVDYYDNNSSNFDYYRYYPTPIYCNENSREWEGGCSSLRRNINYKHDSSNQKLEKIFKLRTLNFITVSIVNAMLLKIQL